MPPLPLAADEAPPLPPFSVVPDPADAPPLAMPAKPLEPGVAPAALGPPPLLDATPPEALDPPPAVPSLPLSELEHALSSAAAKNSRIAEL